MCLLKEVTVPQKKVTRRLTNGMNLDLQLQIGEYAYSCFLLTDGLSSLVQPCREMLGPLKFVLTISDKRILP